MRSPDRRPRRPLQLERARDGIAGPREGQHEAVALALFDRPDTAVGSHEVGHRRH